VFGQPRHSRQWNLIKTSRGWIPQPTFDARCPICRCKLAMRRFRVGYSPEFDIRHVDVTLRCFHCHHDYTFGVPLDPSEYKKLETSPVHDTSFDRNEATAFWEFDFDYTVEEGIPVPAVNKCSVCGGSLLVHGFFVNEALMRLTINLKCLYCGLFVSVARHLTKKDLSKLPERSVPILKTKLYDLNPEIYEIVRRRLESWGYW